MTLRVSLVQADLAWEDTSRNLSTLDDAVAPLAGATDVVILPEMFTTGFSMDPTRLAEPTGVGPGCEWLRARARSHDAAFIGSVMTRDGARCVNRLWVALPDGTLRHYDKRHLFRMGREHEHYAAGQSRLVVEFRGWRLAPLVCYDLRFPVWSRRSPEFDYDVLVYVANWPARRSFAWQSLLVARAIENQCFVAGVNRIGRDGAGIAHEGRSALLDYLGGSLGSPGDAAGVVTVALDLPALREFRRAFPAHLDADRFTIDPAP
jgi:predicted amidohydrolase